MSFCSYFLFLLCRDHKTQQERQKHSTESRKKIKRKTSLKTWKGFFLSFFKIIYHIINTITSNQTTKKSFYQHFYYIFTEHQQLRGDELLHFMLYVEKLSFLYSNKRENSFLDMFLIFISDFIMIYNLQQIFFLFSTLITGSQILV